MKESEVVRSRADSSYHRVPQTSSTTSPNCARCNPYGEDDQRLVQQCLMGDQQAWAELIRTYRGLVYAIAARFGATRDDAGDILQAVCIEVMSSLSQLKNAHSLRSWLTTLTVRQAILWKRRRLNHVELDSMEADHAEEIAFNPDLPQAVSKSQQERIVRDGVAQLPARSAELVRMLFYEQPPVPYEEVARRLGLATGSIGFIRGRALTKLRKILAEAGLHKEAVIM